MLDMRASSRALVHVSGVDRISGSGCSDNQPDVRPVATCCAPLRSFSVNALAVCGLVAGPNSMVNAIYSGWLVDVALLRC